MARNTDKFFELIDRTFSVDEITPEKIMEEFYSGTPGKVRAGTDRAGKQRYQESQATLSGQSVMRGLAERMAEGRNIIIDLEKTNDYDELRSLRRAAQGLDIHSKEVTERVETKMKIVSKELAEVSEQRKKERLIEIEKEKQEKVLEQRKVSIEEDFDDIEDLRDLDNVKSRVKKLSQKTDVSELDSRLEEIRISLELQREAEKEERTRIIREQQEESRLEKEKLRSEGIEPNF